METIERSKRPPKCELGLGSFDETVNTILKITTVMLMIPLAILAAMGITTWWVSKN